MKIFLLVLLFLAACGDNSPIEPHCDVVATCIPGGPSAPRDAQCVTFVRVATDCQGGGDMEISHSIGDKVGTLSLTYECGETFITEWQVTCEDVAIDVTATSDGGDYSCSSIAVCP